MDDQHTTVAQLRQAVAGFIHQRRWQQFHDPKNLAMSIAIEAAELMEHFQWLRSDQLTAATRSPRALRQIRDELADVMCFLLSFANTLEIDLSSAVRDKLVKNARKYPARKYRGRFQ